tara:strand:+ start:755 stop:877 length:123 start_codon:yes stop_codon:yes gene_type:complete
MAGKAISSERALISGDENAKQPAGGKKISQAKRESGKKLE